MSGLYVQKVKTGIQYIIAQCVGGVLGAYAAFNLLPGKLSAHLYDCCSHRLGLPLTVLGAVTCLAVDCMASSSSQAMLTVQPDMLLDASGRSTLTYCMSNGFIEQQTTCCTCPQSEFPKHLF